MNGRSNERKPAANSRFTIGGVLFSADSFLVTESSVLRTGICGEKPAHRNSVISIVSYNQRIKKHICKPHMLSHFQSLQNSCFIANTITL